MQFSFRKSFLIDSNTTIQQETILKKEMEKFLENSQLKTEERKLVYEVQTPHPLVGRKNRPLLKATKEKHYPFAIQEYFNYLAKMEQVCQKLGLGHAFVGYDNLDLYL